MLVLQKNNTSEDSLLNGVHLVKLLMRISSVNNLLKSLQAATSTTEDHVSDAETKNQVSSFLMSENTPWKMKKQTFSICLPILLIKVSSQETHYENHVKFLTVSLPTKITLNVKSVTQETQESNSSMTSLMITLNSTILKITLNSQPFQTTLTCLILCSHSTK